LPEWTDTDRMTLATAVDLLEHPGLVARLATVVGGPLEKGFALLPSDWRIRVAEASRTALFRALEIAVKSLGREAPASGRADMLHRLAATASGVAGGAFGLGALAVELPVSTTIMLRSIAAIAREQGEDLRSLHARLQCLDVFALGSGNERSDGSDGGYWAMRIALSRLTTEAATFVAERGLAEEGAPPLVRLITTVAARFGTVVSEEVAAKAIPVVGAVSGGTINYFFTDHFQKMARGHFSVRRLERRYGEENVRAKFEEARRWG